MNIEEPCTPAPLRFVKGHGTENDFVLIDDLEGTLDLSPERVARIADRRAGIGGDGVIRVVPTAKSGIDAPADAPYWFMDYRNADGSLAEMCGNGVRVFAAHLQRSGHVAEPSFAIWTRAGVRHVEILSAPENLEGEWIVQVGMGVPTVATGQREVRCGDLALEATDVDMGNPHAVAFLPEGTDLEAFDLERDLSVEPAPEGGTNIEIVAMRGDHHVAMRVLERGVGETRSCGTGVAATAVAAARAVSAAENQPAPWTVDVPGGRLEVAWGADGAVLLTGPAAIVAEGTLLLG